MEETLRDKPEVFVKVLETLCEFDADTSQAPPALFNKISKILEPWPELLQGFAPFLMPEQAHKCGLVSCFVLFSIWSSIFDLKQHLFGTNFL